MAQSHRLGSGGTIDRTKPLAFTFDGQRYEGYAGDTLAAALLANGVHLVGRSFKYHRPRGIVAAGAEEPNALLQLGRDPATDPNAKATQVELVDGLTAKSQNRWPSLRLDVGAINSWFGKLLPSGFYYKTFMWPPSPKGWLFWERFIRRAAGLGKAPTGRDPATYDKTFAHCDVLIVGAGPAGLAAALAAGRSGARVLLVEQDFRVGGALLSAPQASVDGLAAADWLAKTEAELAAMPRVRILKRTVAFGYYDHNFLSLMENVTDHLADAPAQLPRHRLWKVRSKQTILATGAIERPLLFRDNDRPGVMLASAVETYIRRYAVLPGRKAVVLTNNDSGYGAALALQEAGAEVTVADLRGEPSGPLTERAEAGGLRILAGHGIAATEGTLKVTGVQVAPLTADGQGLAGPSERITCDLVANSGGWTPSVHLFSQARGKLVWDETYACYRPGEAGQRHQASVGSANGAFALAACLDQGHAAGVAAATALGLASHGEAPQSAEENDLLPLRRLWLLPSDSPLGHKGKWFVDPQNDVTAADLKLALREGYSSIEHLKRYTTTGMATDQGKTSNVNAIAIAAETLAKPVPEVGVTAFRAPYIPVTFGAFMGRDADDLLDPLRKTPIDPWHEKAGAAFENVGQWRRAWYYPKPGEDLHAAVNREVLAVRRAVGLLDASTLGKIDIQGPDAAEFLNRIYTNAWSKLEIGRCRYGLILKEDGMVMDDGVTARLGPNRFLMHTTSGNAAAVMALLEEYLQTEWPQLRVFCTSVTEQFATIQLAGPKARALLQEVAPALNLSANALPHMAFVEGEVAGAPARVFRISFTGETSFEINVPASWGLAVWEALMTAGAKHGIAPYGTEAMHVLRAEKGYIIVGQETDGSVTPLDLGMEGLVSKTKDFVGKRSLFRSDMTKPDRKQLVGLLTDDPACVLPEGTQLTETTPGPQRPFPMIGHVTSSYWSPTLGRSIALALVKGGRARKGSKIVASIDATRSALCAVVDPVFYDKEGERLRA